jgi:hypothetical protein
VAARTFEVMGEVSKVVLFSFFAAEEAADRMDRIESIIYSLGREERPYLYE